jgi:hypothetical protein
VKSAPCRVLLPTPRPAIIRSRDPSVVCAPRKFVDDNRWDRQMPLSRLYHIHRLVLDIVWYSGSHSISCECKAGRDGLDRRFLVLGPSIDSALTLLKIVRFECYGFVCRGGAVTFFCTHRRVENPLPVPWSLLRTCSFCKTLCRIVYLEVIKLHRIKIKYNF